MKEYDESKIPADILAKINSEKNSNESFAERYVSRLQKLIANKLSFVTSRDDRYQYLIQQAKSRSPQQCYASNLFLGPESVTGYQPISLNPVFNFPLIDAPQLKCQVGWHFFVGNFTDAQNNHYSVELMFWQYAQLPPDQAAALGLSDIENQTIEVHLAICDPQKQKQYRATPAVVAGTTGLLGFTQTPFTYNHGRNTVKSVGTAGNPALFPLQLTARGYDMSDASDVTEIEINLTVDNMKGMFLEGDEGCSPSVDGIGTLYYSGALLKPSAGATQTISINGMAIELKEGRMWYDHQWGTGFMPPGAPQHGVLRASQNLSQPAPGGWDWFMFQFYPDANISKDGEVQITVAALHTLANQAYYKQSGPTPPPVMVADFNGKYIDPKNNAVPITGTMTVSKWVQVNFSPDPKVYLPTNTWYPAHYEFSITGTAVSPAISHFFVTPLIASGQTGFFGNGLQYTEGGATITNASGTEIGRGFAEGTGWADNTETVIQLAGLQVNAETKSFMKAPVPSAWMKIISTLWIWIKGAELKKLLAEAKGL
jgi:predicted secreted hydrolase